MNSLNLLHAASPFALLHGWDGKICVRIRIKCVKWKQTEWINHETSVAFDFYWSFCSTGESKNSDGQKHHLLVKRWDCNIFKFNTCITYKGYISFMISMWFSCGVPTVDLDFKAVVVEHFWWTHRFLTPTMNRPLFHSNILYIMDISLNLFHWFLWAPNSHLSFTWTCTVSSNCTDCITSRVCCKNTAWIIMYHRRG